MRDGGRWKMGISPKIVGIVFMLFSVCFITVQIPATANLPPIADAGGFYAVSECLPIELDASASFDPDMDDLFFRWDFEDDSIWDTNWSESPVYEHTWRDDFSGFVRLEVTDGYFFDSDTASITISNVEPFITEVYGPFDPVGVGDPVELTVEFFDGNDRSFLPSEDTYVATFIWEEGVELEYYLSEGEFSVTSEYSYAEPGEYIVEFSIVDDDDGMALNGWVVIVIEKIVDAGDDAIINEGETYLSEGSYLDPGFGTQTGLVDYGEEGGEQELALNPDGTFSLEYLYGNNDLYQVTVTIFNDGEWYGSDAVEVEVLNVAPNITDIIGEVDPMPLGSTSELSVNFTDPGIFDAHLAQIWWTNESYSEILIEGERNFSGNHTFIEAGVYSIVIYIEDEDGANDTEKYQYIVVFNPDDGFVTGGGWINSPEGAYPADPNLTGKATFGFVSKYKKGQSQPSGNTEFQFHAASLNFHSRDYDWLVIAGTKAMYKGTGTINGEGNYGFLISAVDGDLKGDGHPDKFRIKIWDKDQGDLLVYDNNIGDDEEAEPTTILGEGQIKIHKK